MKKMVLAALSALLVACQVAAGIFSSEPKWLSAPENVYPSAQYFSAVGSGPDRSAAELSAKFALCQNLGERIVGEQRTSQTLTRSSSEATLEINVTEEAIFNHVVGIAIKDTYSEKKKKVTTYYAVAVLNKAEAASYYASKVSQLDSEISALLAEADAAAGSMKAIGLVNEAVALAEENDYNLELLAVIRSTGKSRVSYGSASSVRQAKAAVAATVGVYVRVAGDESGRILSAFSSVLREYGMKVSADAAGCPYQLLCDTYFENTDVPGNQYKFVRYAVDATLVDAATGAVVLPYNRSGREGHMSYAQAKSRTIVKIEEAIQDDFAALLDTMVTKL